MGHHDFPGDAGWLHAAVFANDLDDDVIRSDVHGSTGAFMRDEAGIAPAVSIGHLATKHLADGFPLVIIETFRRDKRDFDPQLIHG